MIDKMVIGPITYQVEEVTDLHTTKADGVKQWLHGHIVYADAQIRVASDQSADMKVATLWHEALHGILDQAGVDEHPEAIIRALGYGLVSLVRNNPDLVKLTAGHE